jgi:ATP-dependent DNA helicase RecG
MEDLRVGRAVSRRYRNRRIGEFLKELDLTEGRATGIPKILKVMRENGSPKPQFETDEDRTYFLIRLPVHERVIQELKEVTGQVGTKPAPSRHQVTGQVSGQVTGQVTGQVKQLIIAIKGGMSRSEIQAALGLTHRDHFTEAYLQPALAFGLIEMTIPDKPRSSKQRYRLTDKGRQVLEKLEGAE